MISYLFANITSIGSPNIFIYGGFVFLTVYAYTELMDKHFSALFWELAKNVIGIAIIYYLGDWFGSANHFPLLNYVAITYFIISSLVTTWFVFFELRNEKIIASQPRPEMVKSTF